MKEACESYIPCSASRRGGGGVCRGQARGLESVPCRLRPTSLCVPVCLHPPAEVQEAWHVPWILPTGEKTLPSEGRELGRLGREIARFYGTQESNCCFKRRYKPSGSRKMLWTMELDLCCCRVYLLFPGGQSVTAQVILLWGLLLLRPENYNLDGQFVATEQ